MCRRKKQEFNRREALRYVDLSRRDPGAFWTEIKKHNKRRTGVPDCDFYGHFSSLADTQSRVGDQVLEEIEIEQERITSSGEYIHVLDRTIDMEELEGTIQELRKNKATGEDLILNEFIIHLPLCLKILLLAIFNCILDLEYFPTAWCTGNIIPVFKKGDKYDANNYRGICLLSCMGKLFTRIMNNRLNKWAENETVICDSQYGFRNNRSTTDCIFIMKGLIDILLANGKKMYAVFVDYQKAYDYLDRTAVFYKLSKNGVSSKCVNIFKSMYSKMKLNIRGGVSDQYFMSNCGLLQGESTSPLLFSIFVSDLKDALPDYDIGVNIHDTFIKLLMFADDTVIFSETKEGLQMGLDSLWEYCLKWGLTVNIDKTKIVVFRKGGKLKANDRWNYGGEIIDIVSSFKYLGCTLSTQGSFTQCISDLINSGRRALFGLKKCFSRNTEILPSMQLQLFNTLVAPILFYGSEVWGLQKAENIDTFYTSFLKSLLCVKKSTPNCFVHGELGTFPLRIERNVRVLKYWLKIIYNITNNSNYVSKVYVDLYQLSVDKPNTVTWCTQVRDMLNTCGYGYVWTNQGVYDCKEFVRMFRQRMRDMYLQEWCASVSMTSQNRLYRSVKNVFRFENYLNINNRGLRVALSRLRLSSHTFMIERGRWGKNRLHVNERKCSQCGVIEDEFHCIIKCPRFNNEREGCLLVSSINNQYDFYKLLQSNDMTTILSLGMLCYKIQKEYKNFI